MISDDLAGVAKHLATLVDRRGRLHVSADTAKAVFACLNTIAEQMAIFERNAARLDALPVPADDPVKLVRELGRMDQKVRALAAETEKWEGGALPRSQQKRIDAAVCELANTLDDLVLGLHRRDVAAVTGSTTEDSHARARDGGGGCAEVVSLSDRRAARAATHRAGPGGSAA